MTPTPFALLYVLAACLFAVLRVRMCGGGIEMVAYGIFSWFGSSPDQPGNFAGTALQSLSPVVLLGAAYLRSRTIGSRSPLYLTLAAMVATWLHPIYVFIAKPLGLLGSTFGGGLNTAVLGLDVALPAALYGACLALALQSPARRSSAVT